MGWGWGMEAGRSCEEFGEGKEYDQNKLLEKSLIKIKVKTTKIEKQQGL